VETIYNYNPLDRPRIEGTLMKNPVEESDSRKLNDLFDKVNNNDDFQRNVPGKDLADNNSNPNNNDNNQNTNPNNQDANQNNQNANPNNNNQNTNLNNQKDANNQNADLNKKIDTNNPGKFFNGQIFNNNQNNMNMNWSMNPNKTPVSESKRLKRLR